MEKASGVYATISDNSFQTGGTQALKVIVPMLTTKGKLGLNYVTADTFKDIVGYDVDYNPNYLGLSKILKSVSYAQVLRLNQNAYLANAYFTANDGTAVKASVSDAESEESVTNLTPKPKFAVGNKDVGNWQKTFVKLQPTHSVETVINNNPTSSKTQVITFDDVSSSETTTVNAQTVKSGCILYNSSDNYIVGVIKDTNVYKVVNGVIASTSSGTATWTSNKLTLTLSEPLSNDVMYCAHIIPSTITKWTLMKSKESGSNKVVQDEYDFSLVSTDDNYYKNVDFGELFVYIDGDTIPSAFTAIRNWFSLDNGNNGSSSIVASKIDTSVLDACGYKFLAMNGITSEAVVNAFVNVCEKNKIHIFADAPAYSRYIDVQSSWASKIANSEYVIMCARPDKVEVSEGEYAYIYPSVNYVVIFANMLSTHGYLNFPPAGPTYGTISVENLIDCDFEMYANELKTARINWQRNTNSGTMIWEQRTTYAPNSDLSYIAPTFIVDSLVDELIDFETGFNFRYITQDDILNQQSGLTDILDRYIGNNFLYSYELKMPTYEEAQKSGRTLDIPINVVVMKDGEVINLKLQLNNA